jgi:DNA-binding response OmpR family regulator
MRDGKPLDGKRLLIVEDEYFIAMELTDFVEERGGEVVATTGQLHEALQAAQQQLHGALVDVQLGEEQSFPLIQKLREAGVPLILMTGYNAKNLPEEVRDCPIMTKPFQEKKLEELAVRVFCA